MTIKSSTSSTHWTLPQRAAIEHVAGDLLVSAAAGSGKTAVLAERCARLVCDVDLNAGGCSVDALLVLTFTEAAANEMPGRIAQAIGQKLANLAKRSPDQIRWLQRQAAMVDRASISTLHAFCVRVLRQHFHEAQIDPAFEVIDEDEARLLREETLDALLATWHKQISPIISPASTAFPIPTALRENARLDTVDFATFFEAYAQGRESTCREIIIRVHKMLESTADPIAYIAAAREIYSPEGRKKNLDYFARETVANQIYLVELAARRSCGMVQSANAPAQMLNVLQAVADLLARAQSDLAEKSAAAIPAIRTTLQSFVWPTLKTPKDFPEFKTLKDQTWEKIKEGIKKLHKDTLALDPDAMLQDLANLAPPLETLLALVTQFTESFTAAKRAQNRLDFADLERLTLNLLTAKEAANAPNLAAAELRRRYHHVLVDEFQDINPLQAALLEALRSPDRFGGAGNLFVVGDVKQSIYGFRLADPNLFLQREQAARASATRPHYVGLPHNFRSHPNLLAAMNSVFEKLLTREVAGINYHDGHSLQPSPNHKSATDPSTLNGSPVELHLVVMKQDSIDESDPESTPNNNSDNDTNEFPSQPRENPSAVEEEARMVADRIASLMAENRTIHLKDNSTRSLKFRDIAILLRSMKDKAMIFARALATRGIPVHADLSTGYFDTPEVSATLNLLRVLDNSQQDIPLAGALLGPYGQFSHDDLALIRLTYDRKLIPFHEAVTRYAANFPASRSAPPHNPDLAARLARFLEKLILWRNSLRTRPLHEGLAGIYADARIFPYLAGLDAGPQRVANLHALHQRALKFSAFRKQGLHRFLRFIEKLADQEADYGEAPVLSEASDVVRIMSVHKSKGLEFPVVFASGLGNLLNLIDTGPVFVHRTLGIGLHVADVERNIFYRSAASSNITHANQRTARAEELRLLYVALTRARDHLILTGQLKNVAPLDTARTLWQFHKGPLPEDILLKARTSLDWFLPALACSSLKIQWPDKPHHHDAQLVITLHAPASAPAEPPQPAATAQDETIARLLQAQPLPDTASDTINFDRLFNRITGVYAHEALAHQSAVMTVSQLKSLPSIIDDEFAPSPLLTIAAAATRATTSRTQATRAQEARDRGIVTHRILQLLDLTLPPDSLKAQIDSLIATGRLDKPQSDLADIPGILWFLNSQEGRRLRAASSDKNFLIRREIPFAWVAPLDTTLSQNPADFPTIRGIIDVLLLNRATQQAEIFDYKTDSAFTWEKNIDQYTRQMRHYLKAASEILSLPLARATLLFFAPQKAREILPPPATLF